MDEALLNDKLRRLRQRLLELRRVIVAFSGGVDSTFVLKTAAETLGPENVLAVISRSPSLAQAELHEARDLAQLIGSDLMEIETDEMEDPRYQANPTDRCYYCKAALFTRLEQIAKQHNYNAILTGLNADDLGDWRPGIRAAKQFGVCEPAAEVGLTKQEIRELSRRAGLPTADKPAMPCLASRIPYGEPVTPEKLSMIEQAEHYLRSLGLAECRVRHHGNMARIEIPVERITEFMRSPLREQIVEKLREIGYIFVAMDMRGLRSGSLNEVIGAARTRSAQHP